MLSPMSFAGLAALAGLVAFGIGTGGGSNVRHVAPLTEQLDAAANSLGFGIEQVELTGHAFTSDRSIFDTLDLANVQSMLRLDSAAVRQRIERLPWIDTASVSRLFPDRVVIAVTERRAFARWQNGGQTILIDRTGRELSAVAEGAAQELPLVTGEGAAEHAAALLALLARHPQIRLDAADRIDSRRWTLRLQGSLTVHLPPEGEAAALERLAAVGAVQKLSALAPGVIDLRVPGRLIVRKMEGGAASTQERGSSSADGRSSGPAASREPQRAERG